MTGASPAPPKPLVTRSIEASGGALCVDLYQRADTSWGFEEYRRDVEDGHGWFPVGFHQSRRFTSEAEALTAARDSISWLADSAPE